MNKSLLIKRILGCFSYWVLVLLPLTVAGWIIVPLLLVFVNNKQLPKWGRWFDNLQGPDGDGIHGDQRYQESNPPSFWSAYKWLAFRNPVDYFKGAVSGLECSVGRVNEWYRHPNGEGVSDWGRGGLKYLEFYVDGDWLWEIYWVYPYRMFNRNLCIRIRLGYKLVNRFLPGILVGREGKRYIQYEFSINPFQPFRGGA